MPLKPTVLSMTSSQNGHRLSSRRSWMPAVAWQSIRSPTGSGGASGVTGSVATIACGWAPGGFDALTESDFAALAALKPEVALFGSGATMRFPHPRLTRALTEARIGLEVMDTPAACRTYNILAAEGRRVAAAILVGR